LIIDDAETEIPIFGVLRATILAGIERLEEGDVMQVEIDGKRIAYEERGEGRAMVFLHGSPLDRRSMIGAFDPILRRRAGWRRVYPDLPGMGETGAVPGVETQDQVLDLLAQLIQTVAPSGKPAVVGMSYGGFLAQGLAARMGRGLSGLLAVVPSMGERGARVLPPSRVIHREPVDFAGLPEASRRSFEDMAVVQTQEHLEGWKRWILPGIGAADHVFLERLDRRYRFSFDHRNLPEPFEAPALFLTGRQDAMCGYEEAWSVLIGYPRASFAVLDRAGHCLNFEQPKLFGALVEEWIDSVEEYLAAAP